MVELSQVVISNQTLQSRPPGLVSVFVGASHEFERATLRCFAKYENAPKVYIVDSSCRESTPLSYSTRDLETINPAGAYKTFDVRIGLLSEIDNVCDEIRKVEGHVDLLVMSCGFLRFPPGRGNSTISSTCDFLPSNTSNTRDRKLRG